MTLIAQNLDKTEISLKCHGIGAIGARALGKVLEVHLDIDAVEYLFINY